MHLQTNEAVKIKPYFFFAENKVVFGRAVLFHLATENKKNLKVM
jgi:hypothetical protein